MFDELMDHGFMNRIDAERAFLVDLITRKFPKGIVSYVADSFDFWAVLTEVLPAVKDKILARETNGITPGKLVIRPDSGDPVKVVCGLTEYQYRRTRDDVAYPLAAWDGAAFKGGYDPIPEHEIKGAVEVLWDIFGGTTTPEGYKLLDEHIGLIYGDSITPQRCLAILTGLKAKGFASGNVVFGVGSYTYQCNTRDSFGFAVKATYTEVGERKVSIFKAPKTDSKKNSAKGLLCVGKNTFLSGPPLLLQDDCTSEQEKTGLLLTRFKDGKWFNQVTLDEIRARLA